MPNLDLPVALKRATSVVRDDQQRVVRITWLDGHVSEYGYDDIRRKCPCALCMGEFGSPGVIDLSGPLSPSQTHLMDIQTIGRYAISLMWADGHNTGIYSWIYLRLNCPCQEDRERSARLLAEL